jgi:urease gamma subunit
MHLTPRESDKLLICMVAEVALKRREQGLKLPPRGSGRRDLGGGAG